eukprot:m.2447 g.2447  ORF g.2447 m.2447 type:complete len:889 (+) comp8663_c0_seq1:136-2802(+)
MTMQFDRAMRLTLQCGLVREQFELRSLDMQALFDRALHFLERQHAEHINQFLDLHEHILLMHHRGDSPRSETVERLTDVSVLQPGDVIEVILSAFSRESSMNVLSHVLLVHSYKSPAFCDFCGEMLWGLIRQGLKCQGCGCNYHKRCAYKIPNNCSRQREKLRRESIASSTATLTASHESLKELISLPGKANPGRGGTYACRPIGIDLALREARKISVPHRFATHSYKKPTVCMYCKKLLWGAVRQGKQCKDCKYNVHIKCEYFVPVNCEVQYISHLTSTGDLDDTVIPNPHIGSSEDVPNGLDDGRSELSSDVGTESSSDPSTASSFVSDLDVTGTSKGDGTGEKAEMINIPLMRLYQSLRHTKRYTSQVLKEGFMTHFTKSDLKRKSHWWRLTTKNLSFYKNKDSTPAMKEIPLREILTVDFASESQSFEHNWTPHCFTLHTTTELLYCGENAGSPVQVKFPQSEAGSWCEAIRHAIMPVKGRQREGFSEPKSKQMNSTELKLEDHVDGSEKPNVGELYQIYRDEILGSGQFGIVYAGVHRLSGQDVAVKVIDKARFPTKQETALKNEVAILKNIHHPGIVTLSDMYETQDKVFVVMEKMRNDMLEMILNSPKGRLSERVTKYLIAQILSALRYLHNKNIVHCDLKPENVLLANEEEMPLVKICDFGFSRIIHDHSFRNSVVGTPAYLAPEVLSNQPYNRSLDMWSVGVIIYVSLSGTFPFNEDEEIADQIQNAAFMFPPNPWAGITREAIDLVKRLLRVEQKRRFNVTKAKQHLWFQRRQCWEDLRNLEKQVGLQYLTEPEEEAYWASASIDNPEGHSQIIDHPVHGKQTKDDSDIKQKRRDRMSGMRNYATVEAATPPRDRVDDRHAAEVERRLSQLGFPVSPI